MDELLTEFIAETQETLESLASVIVSWESHPDDRDKLDAMFRFFHTVKGSCGFLSLPRFEKLSHAAEDVLSKVREGEAVINARTINAVLAVMDRIGELCAAIADGDSLPHENDEKLIADLHACLSVPAESEQDIAIEDTSASQTGAAVAAAAADAHGRAQSGPRTIRLPLTLIDQLMNGVSDMVLSRNELSRKLREHGADPELEMAFERLSSCVADMRDTISKTRMQRVERLFMAIPRMVRDISRDLGKQIDLTVEGGDVEMDREMVEMVVDPLTHIVRNSIDHGIETPENRRAAGKSETGKLSLTARQSGSQIVIEIEDDGRGINVEAITRKVVDAGIMQARDVAALSEQEKLELIFTPGLSTAQQVTAISGRGVGMDVVRANIERLGGLIQLENNPGKGLKISLRVPLTLTIIPGLILSAGGQQFAIPRSAVVEILHDNNAMLHMSQTGGAKVATIRGVRYSLVDLEDVIGLEKPVMDGPRTILIVRAASGIPYALGVSSVENHEELVIRPAAPMVMATGVYAGMTLPDNGQPMLLLDAGGIAQNAQLPLEADRSGSTIADDHATENAETLHSALQFREIDGTNRIVRLSLIDRVEDIPADNFSVSAGQTFVRIDGRVLRSFHHIDAAHQNEDGYFTCLRVRDGNREIVYPVQAITDIHEISEKLDMSMAHGHIAGLAIVDGRQMEVIDGFSLFAAIDSDDCAPRRKAMRIVIADGNDGWNKDILAPLLRQAGYDVELGIADSSDESCIVVQTGDVSAEIPSNAPVIRLRVNSSPEGEDDDSIFRYDRASLMQALSNIGLERMSA